MVMDLTGRRLWDTDKTRLEYPAQALELPWAAAENYEAKEWHVRSGLISNCSILPQIPLICLSIN